MKRLLPAPAAAAAGERDLLAGARRGRSGCRPSARPACPAGRRRRAARRRRRGAARPRRARRARRGSARGGGTTAGRAASRRRARARRRRGRRRRRRGRPWARAPRGGTTRRRRRHGRREPRSWRGHGARPGNGSRMPTNPDPVFLITGASTGIGAATARHAAEAGYRVVLAARSTDKLEALAEELGGLAVSCDVTEWERPAGARQARRSTPTAASTSRSPTPASAARAASTRATPRSGRRWS